MITNVSRGEARKIYRGSYYENDESERKRDEDGTVYPERAAKLRKWVRDHHTKNQLMLEYAVELVMQEERPYGQQASDQKKDLSKDIKSTYNLHVPEYREWVDFVIEIFNSGNLHDITGLIRNIDAFKRGNQFDELVPLLVQLAAFLKDALTKEDVAPDATLTSAVTQATDLATTLERARNTLKHLEDSEKETPGARPKRAI